MQITVFTSEDVGLVFASESIRKAVMDALTAATRAAFAYEDCDEDLPEIVVNFESLPAKPEQRILLEASTPLDWWQVTAEDWLSHLSGALALCVRVYSALARAFQDEQLILIAQIGSDAVANT